MPQVFNFCCKEQIHWRGEWEEFKDFWLGTWHIVAPTSGERKTFILYILPQVSKILQEECQPTKKYFLMVIGECVPSPAVAGSIQRKQAQSHVHCGNTHALHINALCAKTVKERSWGHMVASTLKMSSQCHAEVNNYSTLEGRLAELTI